jgi:hypothetical protein
VDCTDTTCSVTSSGHFTFDFADLAGSRPVPSSAFDWWIAWCGGDIGCGSGTAVRIDVAASNGALSIGIFEQLNNAEANLGGTNLSTSGRIGSDGPALGCGVYAVCDISGYWTLADPVPEPSSGSLLVGGLLTLLLIASRRRASGDR